MNWGLRADGGRLRIEVVENGSNDYASGNVILNDKHNTVVGSRQFFEEVAVPFLLSTLIRAKASFSFS